MQNLTKRKKGIGRNWRREEGASHLVQCVVIESFHWRENQHHHVDDHRPMIAIPFQELKHGFVQHSLVCGRLKLRQKIPVNTSKSKSLVTPQTSQFPELENFLPRNWKPSSRMVIIASNAGGMPQKLSCRELRRQFTKYRLMCKDSLLVLQCSPNRQNSEVQAIRPSLVSARYESPNASKLCRFKSHHGNPPIHTKLPFDD